MTDYYNRLDQLHQLVLPRTYIEVGVRDGASMALALPGTRCLGIDPQPDIAVPLLVDSEIAAMTSDEAFDAGVVDEFCRLPASRDQAVATRMGPPWGGVLCWCGDSATSSKAMSSTLRQRGGPPGR